MKNKTLEAAPLVGILIGSDSDYSTIEETIKILKSFEIPHEVNVISAHRTPMAAHDYATKAESKGLEVIIAGAGGAAHLAGVIASLTPLPVIGVPMETKSLGGLDSLLSIVQMPGGVPVATMAIGTAGARNAGIFAAQILGGKYPAVRLKVKNYKESMASEVGKKKLN
jgi:5-(carboxyamino)imidazole ribonucleotide mutase